MKPARFIPLALSALALSAAAAPPAHPSPSKVRYETATPAEIELNRTLAQEFADKTRQTIVPTMHLVETDHFLVYSAWNRFNDAGLADVCERMFRLLSRQFNVPAGESVWIGKCPIYIFWDPDHFARFISEVDHSRKLDANTAHATGYHATRGLFSYIVINGVSQFGSSRDQATTEFYHVLAHEGTHAFLHRYTSNRSVPLWVEEGLADFIAGTLVPRSLASLTYTAAAVAARRDPAVVKRVLDKKKDLTTTEYGISQSLVRFLVRADRNAFVRFLQLMKEGESQEKALAGAYHVSEEQFIQRWRVTPDR